MKKLPKIKKNTGDNDKKSVNIDDLIKKKKKPIADREDFEDFENNDDKKDYAHENEIFIQNTQNENRTEG